MSSEEYNYPDFHDEIINTLIKTKELEKGKNYWEEDEKRILTSIEKYLKNFKGSLSLLDAGSGNGRLAYYLSSSFQRICLVEPDKRRLEESKKFNFEYINSNIESINFENEFDVILCSHVLQHVNTKNILTLLIKLKRAIKKNGILFITTCHSNKNTDYFMKMYLEDSKVIESEINEDQFNSLINNKNITLPEHFFTTDSIKRLLDKSGFRTLESKKFHDERDVFIAATTCS